MSCIDHIGALLLFLPVLATVPVAAQNGLDQDRVRAVAGMLAERPAGVGQPATDRAAWDTLAAHASFQDIVSRAERLLAEPIPDQPDDLYLDFSRTGNRTRWQRVSGQRRGRVTYLCLAECLENKGRFIPPLEQIVAALCDERTWVMPAHDRSLTNFEGKTIDIDLASSALAWNLATAHYLLGDKLSQRTRELIRDNVRRRILDPYVAMVKGERTPNWWMQTTNNWNAVCLAGVTGAALALVEPAQERALFVVAAEEYSMNLLRGFTEDGYCSEGVGYWNYGFGHYVLLAETIHQATSGAVDLLGREQVRMPAMYGARIQIINGVCPAFADCSVQAHPSSDIMWFVNRRLGLGLPQHNELGLSPSGSLFETGIYAFPNSASKAPPAAAASRGPELRDWFQQAGILICRPGEGGAARMGVALKGGHNAEHHNHNDVGSYVVVLGSRPVLLDPGSEVYTARTFSSKRYESKVLNSYGHPVPLVAGKLQRTGREARGQVLETSFTDAADTLRLDIASAYEVPELQKLERTFVYSRESLGSLTVTDSVAFATPQHFGTALITLGEWQRDGERALLVYDFDEAVRVQISATGEFELQVERIEEDSHGEPKRIGINLAKPVTEAAITVTITPIESEGDEGRGVALRNAGFERGAYCWDLSGDTMGSVSSEQAASGRYSLKIEDADTARGSNIRSPRIRVQGASAFVLRGKLFRVSGDGVGMYVYYRNERGEPLNEADSNGNIAPVGSLGGTDGAWTEFAFPFKTPPETASIEVWIHSFNAAQVVAYVDDLEIVPAAAQ